jgi:hypothetical protein
MNQKMLIIPIEKENLSELIEKSFKAYAQEACDKILAKA